MPFAAYSAFKGFVFNNGTFSVTKKTGFLANGDQAKVVVSPAN